MVKYRENTNSTTINRHTWAPWHEQEKSTLVSIFHSSNTNSKLCSKISFLWLSSNKQITISETFSVGRVSKRWQTWHQKQPSSQLLYLIVFFSKPIVGKSLANSSTSCRSFAIWAWIFTSDCIVAMKSFNFVPTGTEDIYTWASRVVCTWQVTCPHWTVGYYTDTNKHLQIIKELTFRISLDLQGQFHGCIKEISYFCKIILNKPSRCESWGSWSIRKQAFISKTMHSQ